MRSRLAAAILASLCCLLMPGVAFAQSEPESSSRRSIPPGPGAFQANPSSPGDPKPVDPAPVDPATPRGTPGGFLPQDTTQERQPELSPPGVTPTPIPPPPAALPQAAADPESIVSEEILVVSNSLAEAIALAQTLAPRGLAVQRRQTLGFLGNQVLSTFRLPEGRSVADVLGELRRDLPQVFSGPNTLFRTSGETPRRYARKLIAWPNRTGGCGKGLHIGVIDTGLDTQHPAFLRSQLTQRSFLPAGVAPATTDHGTAVASLLVGTSEDAGFRGLLPAASLTMAAVFHRTSKGTDLATSERIILALDWLGTQGLRLINLSLAGPEDQVLELVLTRASDAGLVLVAAAGNAGPDAPPSFPAIHPRVITATAVDANREVWEEANRGDYIDFAAPGVDVWSARAGGDGRYRTGTSFAVPYVLAALAAKYAERPNAKSADLAEQLRASVKDLGAEGKDPVFGWGLIQQSSCGPSITAIK